MTAPASRPLKTRFFTTEAGNEPVREWLLKLTKEEMKTRVPKSGNPHRGSSFEDFLDEQEIAPEVTVLALKRVLSLQLQEIIEAEKVSKVQLATRMHTSRAAVDRLLDPMNSSLTFASVGKAAAALGRKVEIRFVRA